MTHHEPDCAGAEQLTARDGHHHGEPCTLAWRAVDVQQPAELVDPFAHTLQAEVRARRRPVAGLQSLTVVATR